jgi:glycosyltransferase involved in cell wall biosynthesis
LSGTLQGDEPNFSLAVIIPCFRVAGQLAHVLNRIGPEVHKIYCVIDGCDQGSGTVAEKAAATDSRIRVVYHSENLGVGAACITGYQHALRDGATVLVKIDGDGQMSPADLLTLVQPILQGKADYVKANRFSNLENLRGMPTIRMIGNLGLSFLSKLSSGYWNIFDPTNGFTAMHWRVASMLPWDRISKRYFFESDLLFRLYTLRAVILDRPLPGRYADERSSLLVWRAACEFPFYHLRNFAKRLFYCYLLRDFNIASLNLVLAIVLLMFGTVFGAVQWVRSVQLNEFASAGTVMLAALPFILGWQALLAFFTFDLHNIPTEPLQRQYL